MMKVITIQLVCLAAFALCGGCNSKSDTTSHTQTVAKSESSGLKSSKPQIETKEYFVEHEGIRVHVRRKFLKSSESSRILVLIPSATYSTRPNWDLQFGDYSIMDAFAKKGWDVVAVDLPGYGKSDDPVRPATSGAIEALPWLHRVIEQVLEEKSLQKVDLLGWSWGSQVAGRYAQEHPDRVRRLVLYGFTHKRRIPVTVFPAGFLNAPFRQLSREGAKGDFIAGCFDPAVASAYAEACVAADDRVPTAALFDYVNRLPLVDPKLLKMPVHVICGQYEIEPATSSKDERRHKDARRDDLDSFCKQLPGGDHGLVVIPGGGHAVHLEKPAKQWLRSVLDFFGQP